MEEVSGELVTGRGELPQRRLRVAMITSLRPQCGFADYSRLLVDELRRHVEVAWVAAPNGFASVMNEADVIHIQHEYSLFGGVAPWKNTFGRLADRISAPAVMTVHQYAMPTGSLPRRMAIGSTNRAQFGHPAIRAFIVHSESVREHLASAGVSLNRIHLLATPVPPRPPMPSRAEARKRLGILDGFVLTIFGFLRRSKGHLTAIEALRFLPEHTRLILAGGRHPDESPGYQDEIRAAIAAAGLDQRVRLTGYLEPEEVATVMAATDLVLAPSTGGSGTSSLAYAFACGKPVLASAIPAHLEIHRRCPGSLSLVPIANPGDLADAIGRLQRDARGLTRLTEGALRYANEFTYARMAAETLTIYQGIARRESQ